MVTSTLTNDKGRDQNSCLFAGASGEIQLSQGYDTR
jgi:hypothetical protein